MIAFNMLVGTKMAGISVAGRRLVAVRKQMPGKPSNIPTSLAFNIPFNVLTSGIQLTQLERICDATVHATIPATEVEVSDVHR
jgi:hypothetical protein